MPHCCGGLLLLLLLPLPLKSWGYLCLLLAIVPTGCGVRLNAYIAHYEPVYYSQQGLQQAHHRVRRSADSQLDLQFVAHSRSFHLRLKRDTQVFAPDLLVENSAGRIHYDTSRAYVGHLQDDTGARVHGVVTGDGVFEGKIVTLDDEYVLERADRHFTDQQPFHSVIYKHSDVQMPQLYNTSTCKSDELHRKMRVWQAQERHQKQHPDKPHRTHGGKETSRHNGSDRNLHDQGQKYKYTHHRHKRGADRAKSTCALYVQADHLFYRRFSENEETVIEQLTQHVQGVNDIYQQIDFDDDRDADNIGFIIKRIKVHSDPTEPGYKFPDDYGVETYLELFSEDNYDAFCLAYMFTHRDFEGGTLGLAWTGDLQNAGGVCEKNGQFRGSLKSLNSGIVTILNYGKDVPSSVSHVTMAHEIGHNMGSQHDPETHDCSPGGDLGNYIMFARATSGDKPNNNKFSTCSKSSMATVMDAKARSMNGCFIVGTPSICGNGVVEAEEECDCGWDDECTDRCCYGQVSEPSRAAGKPCTRRPGAVCSPSEGPCCSSSCKLIGRHVNRTCRETTLCRNSSFCDGKMAACPPSLNARDRMVCNKNSVCYNGECTGSICKAYNMESCQCQLDHTGSSTRLCELCCKLPGEGNACLSSFEWNMPPHDVPSQMAQPGAPCDNYKGYCDVIHQCRHVEPSGPLEHLRNFLFGADGMHQLRLWLAAYWYVLVTAAITFIIFMVIFVKLCTPRKKTTSSPTAHAKTVRAPTPQHVRAPGTPVRPRPQPWLKRQHKQQQQQEALQAQLQANASRAAASNPTSPARRMSPPPPFYSNRLPNTPPTSPFTFEYPSCPSPRRKLGTSKEGWV